MKKIFVLVILVCVSFSLSAYTYDELNQLMLTRNLDILSAREAVQSSLLDYQDAKGGYSPTVDLTVTGSYLCNPIAAIKLQRDQLLEFLGLPDTTLTAGDDYLTLYKGQENMMYQFTLQITQPLFTWGKIPKSVELYKAIYNARALQVFSLSEQKSTEIRTRMAAVVYMQQIRGILLEEKELASQLISLAGQGLANDVLLELDVKEAMVQASELDVAIATLDDQTSQMLRALADLCGVDSLSASEIEYTPNEKQYLAITNTPLSKLESNAVAPDKTTLRLLEKLEEVAALANDIADASVYWKPDIAFVASLGYSGSRFPLVETDWYRQDSANTTLTIALKATVWDGGKALRNVSRTESQKASAAIDTSLGRQQILSSIRENYSKIQLADSRISYYDSKESAALEKVERQKELLDVGSASEADLLKAEMEVRSVRIDRLQLEIELAAAYFVVSYLGS